MKKITMYNKTNGISIQTTEKYKAKWIRLGFVEVKNLILLDMTA